MPNAMVPGTGIRPYYANGTRANTVWGGYVVQPSNVNGYANFYLGQGSWIQPSYNHSGDGRAISYWDGLGGLDGGSTPLLQTGTYTREPSCAGCSFTTKFFWEIGPDPKNIFMVDINAPLIFQSNKVASVAYL